MRKFTVGHTYFSALGSAYRLVSIETVDGKDTYHIAGTGHHSLDYHRMCLSFSAAKNPHSVVDEYQGGDWV